MGDAVVVSGSEDNRICMWDLVEASLVRSLPGHGGPVLSLSLFKDTLVSGAADGVVKVWKPPAGPSAGIEAARGGVAQAQAQAAGLPVSFGKASKVAGAVEERGRGGRGAGGGGAQFRRRRSRSRRK